MNEHADEDRGLKAVFWSLLTALALAGAVDLAPLVVEPPEITSEHVRAALEALDARWGDRDRLMFSPLLPPELLAELTRRGGRPEPAPGPAGPTWVVDVADAPMRVRGVQEERVDLGPLRLRKIERSAARNVEAPFHLYRDLSPELFSVEHAQRGTVRCQMERPEGGYGCPGLPEWVHFTWVSHPVEGRFRDCVWAHPIADGKLVLSLPGFEAPPGQVLELTYGAALSDSAVSQAPNGSIVQHQIAQQGRVRSRLNVPNRTGWREKRLRLIPNAPIQWTIETASDGARHQCIDAWVRLVDEEVLP